MNIAIKYLKTNRQCMAFSRFKNRNFPPLLNLIYGDKNRILSIVNSNLSENRIFSLAKRNHAKVEFSWSSNRNFSESNFRFSRKKIVRFRSALKNRNRKLHFGTALPQIRKTRSGTNFTLLRILIRNRIRSRIEKRKCFHVIGIIILNKRTRICQICLKTIVASEFWSKKWLMRPRFDQFDLLRGQFGYEFAAI